MGYQTTLALFSMFLIPGSLVTCRSTASASARLILSSAASSRVDPDESLQQGLNSPPTSFAVSLLLSLQVLASRTPLTETRLLEVCSARVRPRYFVLINTSPAERGTVSAGLSIPAGMSNALSLPSGDHRTACIPSIRPHPIFPTQDFFAARVLIAKPCSVTTTAFFDDEFGIPTNTPGKNRGSNFSPHAGLHAGTRSSWPLRPCSL